MQTDLNLLKGKRDKRKKPARIMFAYAINERNEVLFRKVRLKDAASPTPPLSLPWVTGYNIERLETKLEHLVRAKTLSSETARRSLALPATISQEQFSLQKITTFGSLQPGHRDYIWVSLKGLEEYFRNGLLILSGQNYVLMPEAEKILKQQLELQRLSGQNVVHLKDFR